MHVKYRLRYGGNVVKRAMSLPPKCIGGNIYGPFFYERVIKSIESNMAVIIYSQRVQSGPLLQKKFAETPFHPWHGYVIEST